MLILFRMIIMKEKRNSQSQSKLKPCLVELEWKSITLSEVQLRFCFLNGLRLNIVSSH